MNKQKKNFLFVSSTLAIVTATVSAAALSASCTTTNNDDKKEMNMQQKVFANLDKRVNALRNTLEDKGIYKTTFDKLRRLIYDVNKEYKKIDSTDIEKIELLTGKYVSKYADLVASFTETYKNVEVVNAENTALQLDSEKNADILNDYQAKIKNSKEAIEVYLNANDLEKPNKIEALILTEEALWNATLEINKVLHPEDNTSAKEMYEFAIKTAEALKSYSEDKEGYESIFDDLFVRNFYAEKMAKPATDSDYQDAFNYLWTTVKNVHEVKFINYYNEEVLLAQDLMSQMTDETDATEKDLKSKLDAEVTNSLKLLMGANTTLLAKIDGKIKLDEALKNALENDFKKSKELYDAKLKEIQEFGKLISEDKYKSILKELNDSTKEQKSLITPKESDQSVTRNDYRNAIAKLQEALDKAKAQKDYYDAKAAYKSELYKAQKAHIDLLENSKYNQISEELRKTIRQAQEQADKDTTNDYLEAKATLEKAITKALTDKENFELNQAKAAYEKAVADAKAKEEQLSQYPKTQKYLTDELAAIDKTLSTPTVDLYKEATKKVEELLATLELNKAKETYEAKLDEATKYQDTIKTSEIGKALETTIKTIDEKTTKEPTVDKYNNGTKELDQTLKLEKAHFEYDKRLKEVQKDKDNFADEQIKSTYNSAIEAANTKATTNATEETYKTGIKELNDAQLNAYKSEYKSYKSKYETVYNDKKVDTESKYAEAKENNATKETIVAKVEIAKPTVELYKQGIKDFKDLKALLEAQLSFLDTYTQVKDDIKTINVDEQITKQIEEIKTAANTAKTTSTFIEKEKELKEVHLKAYKSLYEEAKSDNATETAKHTDVTYADANNFNNKEIDAQDKVVNAKDVTTTAIKEAVSKVQKTTEIYTKYVNYLDKLKEVNTDKETFKDGDVKTKYNADIQAANTKATTEELSTVKFETGINELETAKVTAHKTRYENSLKDAKEYKTNSLDKLTDDYKNIKSTFDTQLQTIEQDAAKDYDKAYQALDKLVEDTKAAVSLRAKELAYLNAQQEFIDAQQNYLNQQKQPLDDPKAQQDKLAELLKIAKEKYNVYVQAAKDYGKTPVEFKE